MSGGNQEVGRLPASQGRATREPSPASGLGPDGRVSTDAGHTPGPWVSDATVAFSDRPDLPCVVDEFRLVVAQCWDDGHSEDECEANARLIAAAPELLDALQGAVKWLVPRDDPRCAKDLHAAEAAIARATGAA